MAEQEKKPLGKAAWITRIVLIVILVLAIVFALKWRGVVAEYNQAVILYEQGLYEEAYDALDAVQSKFVAVLRVRKAARPQMGRCKAEMASDLALSRERTVEAYEKAVQLMKEAIELAGPSEEYRRRLAEYSEYAEKARKAEAPAGEPAPVLAPSAEAPAPAEE